MDYYQHCLSIAKDARDKGKLAAAYCCLGYVYDRQGDWNGALEN